MPPVEVPMELVIGGDVRASDFQRTARPVERLKWTIGHG